MIRTASPTKKLEDLLGLTASPKSKIDKAGLTI